MFCWYFHIFFFFSWLTKYFPFKTWSLIYGRIQRAQHLTYQTRTDSLLRASLNVRAQSCCVGTTESIMLWQDRIALELQGTEKDYTLLYLPFGNHNLLLHCTWPLFCKIRKPVYSTPLPTLHKSITNPFATVFPCDRNHDRNHKGKFLKWQPKNMGTCKEQSPSNPRDIWWTQLFFLLHS